MRFVYGQGSKSFLPVAFYESPAGHWDPHKGVGGFRVALLSFSTQRVSRQHIHGIAETIQSHTPIYPVTRNRKLRPDPPSMQYCNLYSRRRKSYNKMSHRFDPRYRNVRRFPFCSVSCDPFTTIRFLLRTESPSTYCTLRGTIAHFARVASHDSRIYYYQDQHWHTLQPCSRTEPSTHTPRPPTRWHIVL